jgi:hypothetical protein
VKAGDTGIRGNKRTEGRIFEDAKSLSRKIGNDVERINKLGVSPFSSKAVRHSQGTRCNRHNYHRSVDAESIDQFARGRDLETNVHLSQERTALKNME